LEADGKIPQREGQNGSIYATLRAGVVYWQAHLNGKASYYGAAFKEVVDAFGNAAAAQAHRVKIDDTAAAPASPSLAGPWVAVFNASVDTCGARGRDDVDSPARAFVDRAGVVHLVASCRTSRLMTGPSLFEVRDCL